MFTGIVEETGTVVEIRRGTHSAVIVINAEAVTEDLKIGDSVAVNGVCLTVIDFDKNGFSADIMHETLRRSSLAETKRGDRVNLERAMRADGRFGGHIVTGHIDGVGDIVSTRRDDTAVWYTVKADKSVLKYIVEKGSVAIDGISLTVAGVTDSDFSVSVIPHTADVTILGSKKRGDKANIETDIIGKYVEKLNKQNSGITREFLTQYGF